MTTKGRHAASTEGGLRPLESLRLLRGPLTTALLGLGALAMLGAAACVVVLHLSTQTVLTGSMRGTFDPGALVFTREVPVANIAPGDVVVFTPPGESTPYTHRVVSVTGDRAHPVITTKGDANPAPDRWQAQLPGPTVPEVFGSVPHLGRLLLALQARGLRTVLLALLGAIVAVSGTRLILGSPGPRRTSHHTPHPAH